MHFHILTLFPEMIDSGLNTSIIGRAQKAGLVSVNAVNIRDFTEDKHGHVDDTPYGGGAGMIMKCQPIYDAWQKLLKDIEDRAFNDIKSADMKENTRSLAACSDSRDDTGKKIRVIYTSPAGAVFNQKMAKDWAQDEDLIILCGHYEGVDERVLELMDAECVSIGDYVLTGGELAAMVMVDAVSRMVPGVLTNEESAADESFSSVNPKKEFTKRVRREVYGDLLNGMDEDSSLMLLEYPQYTRPEEFMGLKVPEILLSGDHSKVDAWRRSRSVEKTKKIRPDLFKRNRP